MNSKLQRLFVLSAFAALLTSSHGALAADPLLDILQSKGVLSNADVAKLSAVPAASQHDELVKLLKAKGVLSAKDVNKINAQGGSAIAAAPAPARVPYAAGTYAPPPLRATPVPPAALTPATSPQPDAPSPTAGAVVASGDGSPTSFRVGSADFKIGGHIDATVLTRSSSTGNSTATPFGSIPFENTINYHANETHVSAANSLVSLKGHDAFDLWGEKTDITGYIETDFNGNSASNVNTTNSNTLRMRLAYGDVTRGGWELQAGQMYSWLTPNRTGLAADPNDVFLTHNIDQSFQAGLVWDRAAQVRVAYHPTEHLGLGIAVENANQYTGGEVTYPSAMNAQLASQFDNGGNAASSNAMPDIIAKAAYDDTVFGKRYHVDATGLFTTIHDTDLNQTTFMFQHDTQRGYGGGLNANIEPVKGLNFVGSMFYDRGAGRYIGGLGPDTVVKPGGQVSLVASHSIVAGAEWQALRHSLVSLYYSGAWFDQKSYLDTTSFSSPQPYIGFGGPNSANNQNKRMTEWTFDFDQNVWNSKQHGSFDIQTQLSHVWRSPWFVANGAPGHASADMAFVNFQYNLP